MLLRSLASSTITLRSSGIQIPLFGLGTYTCPDAQCKDICLKAFSLGYRHLDTAAYYGNEVGVGQAIVVSGLQRKDIFVTTKLLSTEHGTEKVLPAFQESLKKLDLDYVDLYLMHMPSGGKVVETWAAILQLKNKGLAKAVGVSNFGATQLASLKASGLEMPDVNQFELHVWHQQAETVQYCRTEGITVAGFCPLARGKRFGQTGVAEMAKRLGKSEAQIALRWSIQNNFVTIPKTATPNRLEENASVLSWTLSDEDMLELKKYDERFQASSSVKFMDLPWGQIK